MKKTFRAVIFAAIFLLLAAGSAWAMTTFGAHEEIELSGKVQTRFTFNTEDHSGWTSPQLSAGEMIQHRNLVYVELKHQLTDNVNYRLVGRGLYEGIYDYGPDEYQDVRDANEDEIDDFSRDVDLWEGYVDIRMNKMYLRLGKQIISWGETDLFPMLDRINPLDNTYGGIFEDLDDRRLPLWMAKGIYTFGDIGPFQSLALEGFINPAFMDMDVAPISPAGTPYAFPFPPSPLAQRLVEPDEQMDDSRWGFRLQGVIANNYNWSIAHYETYNDLPATWLVLDPGFIPVQELLFPKQTITGGSLSFYNDWLKTVFRIELAYHWDEPVFIPEVNLAAPAAEIPEKDIFRFAVAVDKNFWIRALNKNAMFNLTLQYFGEKIQDWDDRIRMAAFDFPTGAFATTKEYEQDFVFLVYTNYLSGKINPQISGAYDPRGAWLLLPQVNFIWEPWRLTIQYAYADGPDDVSFGFYKDRDQISFTFSLLF